VLFGAAHLTNILGSAPFGVLMQCVFAASLGTLFAAEWQVFFLKSCSILYNAFCAIWMISPLFCLTGRQKSLPAAGVQPTGGSFWFI